MSTPGLYPNEDGIEMRASGGSEGKSAGKGCDCAGDCAALFTAFKENKISLLFVFIPFGIAAKGLGWSDAMVFFLNFMAIIPLAWILGEATENIASYTGQTIGGLLNATFGNAVEMIMSLFAIQAGLVRVVQGSLLGSILSNLLLVLGMAFFAGGLKYHEQSFNPQGAGANTSLLFLAAFAMVMPSVYSVAYPGHEDGTLAISHSAAIILGLMYCQFLVFQLHTHKDMFDTEPLPGEEAEEEEEEEPSFSMAGSIVILTIVTLVVAACSDALVSSIEGLTKQLGISEGFVGIILLPIIGNAAEHMTAVTMALKNKVDITIGVAVGSSTQIALFVTPFSVLAGWIMGVKMTLDFEMFETSVMLMTILIVGSVINDGKSNWLEGSILMTAYLLVAIAMWSMPNEE